MLSMTQFFMGKVGEDKKTQRAGILIYFYKNIT